MIKAFILVLLLLAAPTWAGQLTLTWTDNSNNEEGFIIYTGNPTPPHNTTEIDRVAANVNTYVDPDLPLGVQKCYALTAFNAVGESAFSNVACGTPSELVPDVPLDLTVTP